MAAVAACPGCRERLELSLDTREMLARSQETQEIEITRKIGEFSMTFRLPSSLDVLAAASQSDPAACRALILERCLLSTQEGDAPMNSDQLPPEVAAVVVESMAEADPLADIQLDAACPACKYRWLAPFDIVSFLWTEIEAWAWRILTEVHTLAAAYGWSEREILTLSPTRRQYYLEMVGA